jgi:hypothetical protein
MALNGPRWPSTALPGSIGPTWLRLPLHGFKKQYAMSTTRSESQLHGPFMGGDSCLDAHLQIILHGITFSHFPGRLFSPRVGMGGYSYLAWLPLQ